MKNPKAKKLKGNIAIIFNDGGTIDYQAYCIKLSTKNASRVFNRYVEETAKTCSLDPHLMANDVTRLVSQLWINMSSCLNTEQWQNKLPQFSEEVIAVLGSGNYVFDFNSIVTFPYTLSFDQFQDVIDVCDYVSPSIYDALEPQQTSQTEPLPS